jgi:hypothetical protein
MRAGSRLWVMQRAWCRGVHVGAGSLVAATAAHARTGAPPASLAGEGVGGASPPPVRPPPLVRPVLIIDLDDTVLLRTRGLLDAAILYAWPFPRALLPPPAVGVPLPHAADTLARVAQEGALTLRPAGGGGPTSPAVAVGLAGGPLSFGVAAVTARWNRSARATYAWLRDNGFPPMPVGRRGMGGGGAGVGGWCMGPEK